MAKSKKDMSFEEQARRNARWTGIPQVHQPMQEVVDPQEEHDALTKQEERDCKKFREGKMVVCAFTRRIQEEEVALQMGEEVGQDEESEDLV